MYTTLSLVKENDISDEMLKAIPSYTELVYRAVEVTNQDPNTLVSIVCYRTKDSMTHQAVLKDGELVVRKSVSKF